MAQSDRRSLQQVRQETEQTRNELTQTVAQLRTSVTETSRDIRQRMKPAAITDQLKVAARENPLKAVAVGGILAYPLLRVMRSVPVPILMIGAGLYLTGSRDGGTATEQISAAPGELSQAAGKRVEEMAGGLSESKASVRARGAELQEGVAQKAGNVSETVKDLADQAAKTGQRYTEAARQATESAVRSAGETASNLGGRATKTFTETLEQNPLVIAGIGLLIGGVIAGALPRTDLEDELLGETKDSVRRRAESAASRGLDAAKDAASEGARRASSEVDPASMRDAMRDVGERVQRVADAAVTTAFESPEENDPSNYQGTSNHG